MSQQKSLFSFYARGGASKPKEIVRPGDGCPAQTQSNANANQQQKTSLDIVGCELRKDAPQRGLFYEIQQKFGCKDKSGLSIRKQQIESCGDAPLVSAVKRIRESDPSSCSLSPPPNHVPVPSTLPSLTSDPNKRRKLMEALGADDGLEQAGAWAAARAKFEWMTPEKIRDAKGRRPGDPLYDERTVRIPDDVFRKLSASQKQYWSTKSMYMDTVLFFKVGKFYELYEVDAEIGHKELDWKLTVSGVGKCRQVGCPESGVDDAVQKLVYRGYKVGRMEQIETAEQARAKRGEKAMVQRELVQILTPATMMDGNIRPEAVHLLALKEEVRESTTCKLPGVDSPIIAVGFAFVDAAAGRFYVGSMCDDTSRSALKTLLTQVSPQEILYENGCITRETLKALGRSSSSGLLPVLLTPLQPNLEFTDAGDAINMFRTHRYFNDLIDDGWHAKGMNPWPTALKSTTDCDLATSALGALASHLTRMKCDGELLQNGFLSPYEVYKGSLRLDGQTVANLELLENRADGGKAGTLLSYLDSCVTCFGKRLLRRWICHPLRNIGDIEYRLDAVVELSSCPEITCSLRAGLKRLPDLERLVARLRGLGASPFAGIASAAKKVHQRRLKSFCSTIMGVRAASDLLLSLRNGPYQKSEQFESKFLQSAAALPYPEAVRSCLEELEEWVDQSSKVPRLINQAKQMLESGEEDELDRESKALSHLVNLFNEHSSHWMKLVEILGQLDVLISFASTIHVANGPTCRPQFVASQGLKKGGSVLEIKGLWHPYASGGQDGAYVPNDVELGNYAGSITKPRAMLLTGPNMGGKSTLLRATCLAVIMAQLGCFVPGDECSLSPVDTIFTRLGASDRIMTGESTFMVECTEAASVLRHATSDSLVILDELGRGTSTFDGYAIAYAVFYKLVSTLDCRLIFATHYHPLTEEFATNPLVSLRHMACAIGSQSLRKGEPNADESSDSSLDKDMIFLYKLTEGASPKSFGLHVALRAGIPNCIVKAAQRAAGMMHERLPSSCAVGHRKDELRDQKYLLLDVLSASDNPSTVELASKHDSYGKLMDLWQQVRMKGVTVNV